VISERREYNCVEVDALGDSIARYCRAFSAGDWISFIESPGGKNSHARHGRTESDSVSAVSSILALGSGQKIISFRLPKDWKSASEEMAEEFTNAIFLKEDSRLSNGMRIVNTFDTRTEAQKGN
jgi:hypothetical protein